MLTSVLLGAKNISIPILQIRKLRCRHLLWVPPLVRDERFEPRQSGPRVCALKDLTPGFCIRKGLVYCSAHLRDDL